jgi:hypothetical protein
MSRLQEVGMPDQAKLVARPWRRFIRFSVRGLTVLVLVIGAGLGWLVRGARIQREAVAAITSAGGTVYYDWERSNQKPIPGARPWAPRWLVDRIGVDYFGHVTTVWFIGSSTAADTTFAQVGHLTRLEELVLIESSVGNAGLAHLEGLTKLKVLQLGCTKGTDAGLVHLKGLNNLSILNLNCARISDRGLEHLRGRTNLSSLDLSGTQVTDAAIAAPGSDRQPGWWGGMTFPCPRKAGW